MVIGIHPHYGFWNYHDYGIANTQYSSTSYCVLTSSVAGSNREDSRRHWFELFLQLLVLDISPLARHLRGGILAVVHRVRANGHSPSPDPQPFPCHSLCISPAFTSW